MNQTKKQIRVYEKIIGLSFILATLTYGIGSSMITELLTTPVTKINEIIPFGILEALNSFFVIVIGVMFFKILEPWRKNLATGYLISRIVEGLLLLTGTVLTLISSINSPLEGLKLHDYFFGAAMLALGIYSTYFCYRLFNAHIGPRWLMVFGILGYIGLTIYSLLVFVPNITAPMALFAPGAIFEIVLPLYLIFKGISDPHLLLNSN